MSAGRAHLPPVARRNHAGPDSPERQARLLIELGLQVE